MHITIVNTLPVPSGEASVNRILSYSKCLVEKGNCVRILSSANMQERGGDIIIEGVKVCNLGSAHTKPLSLIQSLISIIGKICVDKPDIVLLVSNSLLLIYPLFVLCKTKKIRFIIEKSEYPFSLMKRGYHHKLYSWFYVNTTYKLFDGIIVMTKPLMDYFSKYVKKSCKLFEMPMTVDTERFKIEPKKNTIGEYFAYCGNLSNRKDGIVNLLDSFIEVEKKYSNVKLVLIGGTTDDSYLAQLKQRAIKNGLKNVIFYGKVSRDEMPSLLINAKCLLLARPSNLQSAGGFPTKLGEYLSTGKPVVVTAVGDIPFYLNESNSFIVPPDNIKAFSSAMLAVLDDYGKAILVGEKGRELASNVFNAKVQADHLESYLKTLL